MQKVSVACGSSSMDSYLKQQEVEEAVDEINLATAAADKATTALVGSKSTNVAENTMTTTAVPTVPKLTLKRKAPGTESTSGNALNSDGKVLSTYGAVQSHSNANSIGSNSGLSPAAKRRRSGRTSGSNTTVFYTALLLLADRNLLKHFILSCFLILIEISGWTK